MRSWRGPWAVSVSVLSLWVSCCWIGSVQAFSRPRHPRERGRRPITTRSLARNPHPQTTPGSSHSDKPFSRSFSLSTWSETQKGLAILTTVPFAWGTFEPAIRYVYATETQLPGIIFNLGFYTVAFLTLVVIENLTKDDTKSWPVIGGLELGTYLFLGNTMQTLGLKTIPSDKAAFLLQLTTIFVPLGAALVARAWSTVSIRTWTSCWIALMGVGVMGLDGQNTSTTLALSTTSSMVDTILQAVRSIGPGELYIVLAAIAYTFHCLRLEGYAKSNSALRLATCKAATETCLSAAALAWLLMIPGDVVGGLSGTPQSEVQEFFARISTMNMKSFAPVALAILWTGWVPVAYTIVAQSYGQSRVRPVTANLIYTIQPLCTAFVAYFALGESLGLAGYTGAALIGAAVLLVTTEDIASD